MNKYHFIGFASFGIAIVLFLFNFFDSSAGKILFGISIGAGIKFLADGVLLKAGVKK